MMILSRIWYFVLAILAAFSLYLASLAVGQFNRNLNNASADQLKSDTQVVSWAMQIDARRRIDSLLIGSVDESVRKALRASSGKDAVPQASRDDGRRALTTIAGSLPADYKFSAMFLVDREGRVVAQTGYEKASAAPEMELGGYPAVFDALHGFFRDDAWVWGGTVYRVATRPVEDEVGQPPVGAIVGLTAMDTDFAKELAKRSGANVMFFLGSQRLAVAGSDETMDSATLETVATDLAGLADDKSFKEKGRSDLRPVGSGQTSLLAMYARLVGEAGEAGAGVAVVRQKTSLSSVTGFLSHADDKDKKNVSYPTIALVLILGAGLGLLFSYLEHSRPLGEFANQGKRLKKGEIDALQLARLGGGYRAIAQDLNGGIERVAEKGGGAIRKPADLEQILGPVPAQPQMSAFSFPLPEGSGVLPSHQAPGSAPASPPMKPPPPKPATSGPAMPGMNPPGGAPKPPPPAPKPAPMTKMEAPAPELGVQPAPTKRNVPSLAAPQTEEEADESTRVGDVPQQVRVQATGSMPAGSQGDPEWLKVFEEFVRVKKQCGEATEGLTYEKFQVTLIKNRDALIARHNCKKVKFTVYVKEGRASLKATPIKE